MEKTANQKKARIIAVTAAFLLIALATTIILNNNQEKPVQNQSQQNPTQQNNPAKNPDTLDTTNTQAQQPPPTKPKTLQEQSNTAGPEIVSENDFDFETERQNQEPPAQTGTNSGQSNDEPDLDENIQEPPVISAEQCVQNCLETRQTPQECDTICRQG